MADSKKKRAKLPKDVTELSGDDLMRKVFNKRTAEELQKVARENTEMDPKAK